VSNQAQALGRIKASSKKQRKKAAVTLCAVCILQFTVVPMKKLIHLIVGLIVAHLTPSALAQQDSSWPDEPGLKLEWQMSPFTHHFSPSEDHKNVYMVGLEREHANGKLDGVTFFTNSFGQARLYLYPWCLQKRFWGEALVVQMDGRFALRLC
jgi:hypothetical protein